MRGEKRRRCEGMRDDWERGGEGKAIWERGNGEGREGNGRRIGKGRRKVRGRCEER